MLMTFNYIYQWPDQTDQLLKLKAWLKDMKAWKTRNVLVVLVIVEFR